eukprot:s3260_g5.t1
MAAAASSFDPALYKCCRCDRAMEHDVSMVLWDNKPYARGDWSWIEARGAGPAGQSESLMKWDEPTMDWICTWPGPGGKLGQAVPSVAACADKLYCKGCFNAWGWYMKSGPNVFRLALDCDRLGRELKTKVVKKSKGGAGNPFQCSICQKCFNKKTLKEHLDWHKTSQSSQSGCKTEMSCQTDMTWVATEDDFHSDSCWEFAAKQSWNGDLEWQPFLQEVQQELEERYCDWKDLGGQQIVRVTTNGFPYDVNFDSMTQQNAKTSKVRSIRRVLKPNEAVFPILQEKELLLSEYSERNASLTQEVIELKEEVERLKTLANAAKNEHVTTMTLMESWRMEKQRSLSLRRPIASGDPVRSQIQEILRQACPQSHYAGCLAARQLEVLSVEQVHNVKLWKQYAFRKDEIKRENETSISTAVESDLLPPDWIQLDRNVNEVFLLHGTTADKIDMITQYGFDQRMARESGLYGQGVYFTDQSCKSMQYSGAPYGTLGYFILSRVVLGHPHIATGAMKNEKVEPFRDDNDPSQGRSNSVVVNPGTDNGGQGAQRAQVHREFVLFNSHQAYPELVVCFKLQP